MAVQLETDVLHEQTRQVVRDVQRAVVVARTSRNDGVIEAASGRLARRHAVSPAHARELLHRHARRYGHRVVAIADAVERYGLDIDADLEP